MKYLQKFLDAEPPTLQSQVMKQENTAKNLQNLQKSGEPDEDETSVGSVGFSQDEAADLSDLPPALQERPGMEFVEPGLWMWRGFIVPTPATMPAYKKHYEKQAELQRRREQDSERSEPS